MDKIAYPLNMTLIRKLKAFAFAHKKLSLLVVFLLMWSLATFVAYIRFPFNLLYPNFFAEDGSIFFSNVQTEGVLSAVFTPFNGYFVSGIYLCVGVSKLINDLFNNGSLVYVPQIIAFVSIVVFGLTGASVFLLRKFTGTAMALALFFLVLTVPLPATAHELIGTVGNLKWGFFFIAYIIAVYWSVFRKKLSILQSVLLGLVLVVCIYTSAYSYFALVIIGLVFCYDIFIEFRKKPWRHTIKQLLVRPSSIALLLVGILALIQLVYVKLHGIPQMEGYLDAPFD